jgi:hypothetical protein
MIRPVQRAAAGAATVSSAGPPGTPTVEAACENHGAVPGIRRHHHGRRRVDAPSAVPGSATRVPENQRQRQGQGQRQRAARGPGTVTVSGHGTRKRGRSRTKPPRRTHTPAAGSAAGSATAAAAGSASGSIGVRNAQRLEWGIFLVAHGAPESHQAARADPIASHPPSSAPGACDPHGKGRRPRPLA